MKTTADEQVIAAAKALLQKLDSITTDSFALGGERTEREQLRRALARKQKEEAK